MEIGVSYTAENRVYCMHVRNRARWRQTAANRGWELLGAWWIQKIVHAVSGIRVAVKNGNRAVAGEAIWGAHIWCYLTQ